MVKLLIPLRERARKEFTDHLELYGAKLKPAQRAALYRYSNDNWILDVMVNSIFNEWFESEGRPRGFEAMVRKAIGELMKVYDH